MNQPYNIFFSSTNSALGRSLSPDPFACGAESDMQNPENTQNYNRYSYCFNNSMKYTDPSGYVTCYVDGVETSASFFRSMSHNSASINAYGNHSFVDEFGFSQFISTKYITESMNDIFRLAWVNDIQQTDDGSWITTKSAYSRTGMYGGMTGYLGESTFFSSNESDIQGLGLAADGTYGGWLEIFETNNIYAISITSPYISKIRDEKGFWQIMTENGDFGYDGANRGTITKQDIVVGTAVIATIASGGILTEYAMAGASVWEWALASASTVNNIDGVFTNSKGESGIQQMVGDKYKMNVGAAKNLISLLSLKVSFSPSNINNTYKSAFGLTGAGTDFFSIMQPNKSYIKK